MTIPPHLRNLVSSEPGIVGGELCFVGTRVPLETVVDNLAGGHSIERILKNFPTLEARHVEAVLRWEQELAKEAVGFESRAS